MVGLVTFYSSQHAVQGENVLKKAGFQVDLIPGPKEISPNCGVALSFPLGERERIAQILEENHVKYEAIHQYEPKKTKSILERFLGC